MRRVQPWIVMGAAAMLVGAGCGSSQAPVVGGSTGTPADAGSSSDAGTTGDAGTTADAGTTTDAGPTADAGTPDAGTPDGGTDGGTAANDCDGILPTALGPSASANVDPSGSSMCTFATSDLAGNVALERHANSYSFSWTTFTSSGTQLGSLGAVYLLVPRDVGFLGVNFWNGAGAPMDMFHFFAWAPDGSSSGSTSVGSDACTAASFPSSSGGAIVLVACGSRSGNTRAIRFDASGKQLSSSVFLGTYTAAQVAVGDANGNTLIVAYPGTEVGFGSTDLVGRWLGGDGAPLTGWFLITTGGSRQFAVHSLIGDGAAVLQDEVWRAFLPSGGTPQPPPAWLAARIAKDISIVRGRRAYAVTSRTGGSVVELVSPSGNSCGTIDVGGTNVSIGADGTVFTMTAPGCNRTWWSALLK